MVLFDVTDKLVANSCQKERSCSSLLTSGHRVGPLPMLQQHQASEPVVKSVKEDNIIHRIVVFWFWVVFIVGLGFFPTYPSVDFWVKHFLAVAAGL